MKLFAIILASIAALAASTQAYLIWKQDAKEFEEKKEIMKFAVSREFDIKSQQRQRVCRGLMESFADINTLIDNKDELIAEWIKTNVLELEVREDRRFSTDEQRLEEGKRRAESQLIREISLELSSILRFQKIDYVYFTDEVGKQLRFKEIAQLPPFLRTRNFRFSNGVSAESYHRTLDAVEELAKRADDVTSVCTPILLGESDW